MATQRMLSLGCLLLAGLVLGATAWAARLQEDATDAAGPQPSAPVATDPGQTTPMASAAAAASDAASLSLTVKLSAVTIFVLAVFVGFEIITKVPPTLHTPLMSGSNAISGIAVVGALLVVLGADLATSVVGCVAVVLATINVVGGFLVTHRMLAMFRKR